MFDASIPFIDRTSMEYMSKTIQMLPVDVWCNVQKVHRYYPCTITYTYTTRPTRQRRIAPTILRGKKEEGTYIKIH